MSIAPLPQSTVRLLTSSQVITSVSSAVKELVENSLDAGATNIDVKLDNNGLDRIEVKDDGTGVSPTDATCMGLPHYTSKISSFTDIETLESYGFRGEALNALCQVGSVTVTTARSCDSSGTIYVLDKNGQVMSSKPTHKMKGTTIVVSNLFKNLPVRRQFLSNGKRAKEELRRVEVIVKTLGVINPQVRFTLAHNKCLIWNKTSVTQLRQGVVYMVGYSPARELHELKAEGPEIKIEALLPRIGCDISILSKATSDWSMVFVNRRPVQFKSVHKVVCEYLTHSFGERALQKKSPVFLVSFTLLPAEIDVNLEPNKTRVLVKDEAVLLEELRKLLSQYYGNPTPKDDTEFVESPVKKRKLEAVEEIPPVPKPVEIVFEDKQKYVENDFEKAELSHTEEKNPQGESKDHQNFTITAKEFSANEKINVIKIVNPTENLTVEQRTGDLDESMTAEKWSMGHFKEPSGNFIQGPAVFLRSAEIDLPVRQNGCHLSSSASPGMPTEKEKPTALPEKENHPEKFLSPIEECEFETNWFLPNRSDQSPVQRPDYSERLHPVISPPRPRNEKNRKKPRQPEPRADLDLSVSSQMGRREMAGFTKFARDERPQIILENPGMAFTEVAMLLAEKWKNLPIDQRDIYEEKARDNVVARQMKHAEDPLQPKLTFESKKPAEKRSPKNPSKHAKSGNQPNFNRSQTPYQASINIIRERLELGNSNRKKPFKDEYELIGHLEPSGYWACIKSGKEISLISSHRLQEIVINHRLLATYTFPLRPLSPPLRLEEKDLGADHWNLLLSMDRTTCNLDGETLVISSPIIVKNGFRVQLSQRDGNMNVLLTHIAASIAVYGVDDLLETLRLVITNGTRSLSLCRPLKVVNHLKSEAVRICREGPSLMERKVLQELLLYWEKYLSPTDHCLHSKPIWTHISSIREEKSSSMALSRPV